ncbi:MAG: hypothetical protein OXG58_10175 [Gemmatimonadetes bacterium]|nr:hypothetical protein [Gemmatimonadota bacterium]MCY3943057.1 hypothetical protein [Gemmatimonadota bacterium]
MTDGKSFQLTRSGHSSYDGYDAKVPHTFTNRTGANVYIDEGCSGGHIAIDVYEGGEWVRVNRGEGCWISDKSFRAIEPGAVYHDTLFFGCTSGGSCGPRLTLPSASTQFRIKWWAWSSLDEDQYGNPIPGDPLPLEERVSNHFTFEVVE